MAALTAQQQAFVQRHSTIEPFWGEVEDINLVGAALLTLGINPSSLDEEKEVYGEPVSVKELPDDFLPRIEVLRSAIRAASLPTVALIYDEHGRVSDSETRIRTRDFAEWCVAKGIPHNLPKLLSPAPQNGKWPWGSHETKLLGHLAAAAKQWWSTYDPADPTTAPKNKEVAAWLVSQKVSKRNAQLMATLLRPDGLPTGPRKR